MKLFFPIREIDFPITQSTATLIFFQAVAHGRVETLYLLNFQGGTCGGDFQIPESTAIQDFLPADFHSWR